MSALIIIAEHNNKNLASGTHNVVTAAKELSEEIHILVVGFNCRSVAEEASKIEGISKVIICDHRNYEYNGVENIARLAQTIKQDYQYAIANASTFGKAFIPYFAALCDVQSISDISAVINKNTFVRPIYAGNALATVQTIDSFITLTIRATSFEAAKDVTQQAPIKDIEHTEDDGKVRFIEQNLNQSERPELTSAKIVISGGRGVQSEENFGMLEKLADLLGGAVGASRAAVDAGFVPNDYQVGQTGKVVAPDLYIAIGISGAIQHLAGMKDSKTIVAINNDPDAPIFQIADYAWHEDLFVAVPKLTEALEKRINQ